MTISLDDKYLRQQGSIYLTGTQALVRIAIEQRRLDAARGWNTAGFVSGYRGSPLGGLDAEFVKAAKVLEPLNVAFQPGLNEDLAATSVWGTQQIGFKGRNTVDGVFGIWYGKGPGVDRTGDVFKHANLAGTAARGGVLAVFGDDQGNKSSSFPHQSDYAMVSAMMPVLYPATLEEFIRFGVLGIEMSRASGCWVGLKAVGEIVESSATVDLAQLASLAIAADDGARDVHIRAADNPFAQEQRLFDAKHPALKAFARANGLNTEVMGARRSGAVVVLTAGKAWLDTMEALRRIGLDADAIDALGVRLVKLGMTYPLVEEEVLAWTAEASLVLVIEEKRPLIEDQLAGILLAAGRGALRVAGKRDREGAVLFPPYGETSPALIAGGLLRVLRSAGRGIDAAVQDAAAQLQQQEQVQLAPARHARAPFFCAGCPHNTSTRVPDGSRALAGIGCHAIAMWMPQPRAETVVQMGGEGANWIGMSRYVNEGHVFQNLGDGTYFHSGLLAIRAAVSAQVNITYKVLYNDAVAMTGGQPHDGPLTPQRIAWQVHAEGVTAVAVVSDDIGKYGGGDWPPGTEVRHRDDLDAVQKTLRAQPGVTVLVYDQVCAAEKRRRRKRGTLEDPPKRVFINHRVCEGCGDCGTQSNCVAVQPLETPLGRKRAIDQSACNKDFSCLKGFCPSFVTVHGAQPRTAPASAGSVQPKLPEPVFAMQLGEQPYELLVVGMGGTGIVTVGALLGMAARIEGRQATVLDQTGMSQKNGTVASHVRLSASGALHSPRIGKQAADALLAGDLIVAAHPDLLVRCDPPRTRAVLNTHLGATPHMIFDADVDWDAAGTRERIAQRCADVAGVDFSAEAEHRFGDAIAANAMLLGYAWQLGLVPLARESLTRAIELNAAAVPMNLAAFEHGRRLAVEEGRPADAPASAAAQTLDEALAFHREDLAAYQDHAYAARFTAALQPLAAAEQRLGLERGRLVAVAARELYRLLAYKDEYEVARLYACDDFRRSLARSFEDGARLTFHLAPPLLARKDPQTGQPRKSEYGPWVFTAFKVLHALRRLRGTPLDLFGYTRERRTERQLAADYEVLIRAVGDGLQSRDVEDAARVLASTAAIRGFGHVKEGNLARFLEEHGPVATLWARAQAPAAAAPALEAA
ncbi:MAG: indolepyruvate ferredoxin oxidoreductase family protein [Pseudomonadota bacterium]